MPRLPSQRTAVSTWRDPSRQLDATRLAEQIDALLHNMELTKSAGATLRAEDVHRAVMLIRLYAHGAGDADAWIQRERARATAKLLKTERVIGSRGLQHPDSRFTEFRQEPPDFEDMFPAITLHDLVVAFNKIFEMERRVRAGLPPKPTRRRASDRLDAMMNAFAKVLEDRGRKARVEATASQEHDPLESGARTAVNSHDLL